MLLWVHDKIIIVKIMEQEIRTSEQQVNPEPDHQTPVVVVYRGRSEGQSTNPFMEAVATGLANRGLNVINRPIDQEVYQSEIKPALDVFGHLLIEDDALKARSLAAIGNLPEGCLVITDRTLEAVAKLQNNPSVSAYEAIYKSNEEVVFPSIGAVRKYVGPIVEAIRQQGKIPVVIGNHIGDHAEIYAKSFPVDEEEEMEQGLRDHYYEYSRDFISEYHEAKKHGARYCEALRLAFDLPIVLEGFKIYERFVKGSIPQVLAAKKIPLDKAVLLIDHHVVKYTSEELGKKAGLDQVELTLICDCCVSLGRDRDDMMDWNSSKGFKFFPTVPAESRMDSILDNLVSQIKEKEETK